MHVLSIILHIALYYVLVGAILGTIQQVINMYISYSFRINWGTLLQSLFFWPIGLFFLVFFWVGGHQNG